MRIFIIHPIREANDNYKKGIDNYVAMLEKQGHVVYQPSRDTDQDDFHGLRICQDNLKAIQEADEIHIAWDGKSKGCLFDLGMAFALGKTIRTIIGYFPAQSNGKSFQNMVYKYTGLDQGGE